MGVEKTIQGGAPYSVFLAEYYSVHKIKNNVMSGRCSTYGERRGACRDLVRRPEGRRPLERLRHRRNGNIKTNFQVSSLVTIYSI
jgi:hypothetical protein